MEEALRILAGALKMASAEGLDKVEVQRLQAVATLARTYKDLVADYLDYRGIEVQLIDLRQKYEQLAKTCPDDASRQVLARARASWRVLVIGAMAFTVGFLI